MPEDFFVSQLKNWQHQCTLGKYGTKGRNAGIKNKGLS